MVLERKSGIFTRDPLVQEADQIANKILTCGCTPDWTVQSANWYLQGFITPSELINSTKFLVEQGIVTFNNTVIQEPEPFDPLGDLSNFIDEIIVEPITTFVDDTTDGIVQGVDDITQGADDFISNAQKNIDTTLQGSDDWIKLQQENYQQFLIDSQTNLTQFGTDVNTNVANLFADFEQFKLDVATNLQGVGEGFEQFKIDVGAGFQGVGEGFAQFGADVQTNFDNLGGAFEKGFESAGAAASASGTFFENAKNFLSGAGVGALVIVGVLVFFAVRTPKVGR